MSSLIAVIIISVRVVRLRLTGHSPICMVATLPPSLFLASRSLKSLKPFLAR